MLRALLQWLKNRRQPAGAPAVPAAGRAPAPAVAAPQPRPAAAAVTEPDAITAIGARRPLVDVGGRVAGFEFRMPESTLRRLRSRDNAVAAAAHTRALFATMRLTTDAGRIAYTELPPGWLQRPQLAAEVTRGCMIAVPLVEAADAFGTEACTAIRALRAAGARVGWAGPRVQPVTPDFVVVRPGLDDVASARQRGVPLLASDVETLEQLEAMLQAGVRYACCSIASRTEPKEAQPLAPQVQRVCLLLNRLVQDADTRSIVSDIKEDVALAYRLLHHINMAGVGQAHEVDSIEQAVLMLGRNELYRWLSMLLVTFSAGRPASGALQEIALARARLFELLAIDRAEPEPGSLFTLGLASMLGLLLQVKLADAIEPLNLHEFARRALLEASGPWYAYLAVAAELENPKSTQLETLAEPFGGAARVAARAAEAWQWAAKAGSGAPATAGTS
ncbi:EAL and HDOD domain-containing protein [Piscinibacter koreensis]|uniref:HDOD domain-containing protein n=1 Tax=Piscinibacter koreensis TaxID=2742824 RepID=A0A7Y6TYB3_9BURK|nr:HDOD domain-containing protein [Schlegelella koreensis]NUZ08073.1 HDOD domain-containing protein [Schlegelella koreensis]